MYKSIIAASLAAGAAASAGSASVINGCNYDVKLSNVPAANGGYSAVDKTLSPNDSYTQTFTELSNKMGWSLKLSKDDNFGSNILQFEYTYLNQPVIWYDISAVDGNPWDGNWEISAAGDQCQPRQAAYRFATDDAYGMQDCPSDSDITLLLCSGEDQNDGLASSVASAAPSATEAPSSAESSAAAPTTTSKAWGYNNKVQVQEQPSSSAKPTTLITSVAKSGPVVVTEYATEVVTEVVTATHYAGDAHAHRHAARHAHA